MKPNRVEIAYVEPKNPAHRKIYEVLKQRRVLERFQTYLSPLRLPTTLTLKTDGCDGESNAWYEETDHTVTVCYEYIDDVVRNAPDMTTAAGVTPRDAVVGPTVEVFLHEVDVGSQLAAGEAATGPQPNRHGRVEVAARDRPERIGACQNSQTKGERHAGEADTEPRERRGEHCAAASPEHQPEHSDEFCTQLCTHRGLLAEGLAERADLLSRPAYSALDYTN